MCKYTLFGDGINDDTLAIQQLLDTCQKVHLPKPKVRYVISKPLVIRSNTTLSLDFDAEIFLADNSNCVMLMNQMKEDFCDRTDSKLFSFINRYSPSFTCENVEVKGGVWNFNNKGQKGNPLATGDYLDGYYNGFGMLFYNVKGLKFSSLTLKDPVNFAVTFDTVSDFNVHDITFDFNDGNPYQSNMDGLHFNGNCHHGQIRSLKGACYDDTVALNAQEGSSGPISDITIDGIEGYGAYSAVRLLSSRPESSIKNVNISNIKGSYYHFCVALMHCYYKKTGVFGEIENINIDNVCASKSDRALVKFPSVFNYRQYGIIDIETCLNVKNLTVKNLVRNESVDVLAPTVNIMANATVDGLNLENITAVNLVNESNIPLIKSESEVKNLTIKNN